MASVKGRGSAAVEAMVLLVGVLAMASGALAANHVVGEATQQWNYAPTNDLSYYDNTWAKGQTFVVGDTLQFEYTAGQHDVVQYATKAEYTACSGTTVQQWATGNDSVPLKTAGTFYYICGFPGHCTGGMKVSVTVTAAVAPATPPTSATPPPPATLTPPGVSSPPPPPPAGAASSGPVLSMAGLLVAALVATLAFLV